MSQDNMTPERWQQIREVLDSAMRLAPAECSAFLDRECGNDSSLRKEVENLLAFKDRLPQSFLEATSLEETADFGLSSPSILAAGTRLGPYVVHEPIGSGGMGEVYRARDTRLDRTVAIKVMSARLSSDPQRRRRFEREARAISALQHPNICTLYDVGLQDGNRYLVMEYLEGETLASRLLKGQLSLDSVLRYAIEI
jgi:serine/threonine protein kinase